MLKLYSAEWCSNCKPVKKILDENNIKYEVVDIDKESEIARANNIRGIPTLINEQGKRLIGAVTLTQIKDNLL